VIKILIETPVAYDKELGALNVSAWIYMNPTEKEMNEIKSTGYIIRFLTCGNDYYVGSGMFFTHNTMITDLQQSKCISGRGDTFFVVDTQADDMCTGWWSRSNQLKSYKILKPFMNDMISVGLLTEDTVIDTTVDEDMIIFSDDDFIQRLTIGDMLNTDILDKMQVTVNA
jgi:hypothetical protein